MNTPFEQTDALPDFSGYAPIFPLPDVVFYPHVMLPLHIFEPRYREMVADALTGERLIAMALLKPNWEATYSEKSAAIHETVCLGRIVAEHRMADGRYNVALRGLTRATVLEESDDDTPYRVGRLQIQPDRYAKQPVIDRDNRSRELLTGFREMFPKIDLDHVWHQSLDSGIPLGSMCDLLAHAMRLDPQLGQSLLDEIDVDMRSDLLLQYLRSLVREAMQATATMVFPPRFSVN